MTKRKTASYVPKLAKADPNTIITPQQFIDGNYAKRIAAGELSVNKGENKILTIVPGIDGVYAAKTRLGETIYLNPTDHLIIGLPWKPFVVSRGSPFSTPKPAVVEAVYQDAPGPHQPVEVNQPAPRNTKTVAILVAVCERRAKLKKKSHKPKFMGASPIEARERLLAKIREAA